MSSGNIVTESCYDDEGVNKILERHSYIKMKYREQEFSTKLETSLNTRLKGYKDDIFEEDYLVYYQAHNGNPLVRSSQSNSEEELRNMSTYLWLC